MLNESQSSRFPSIFRFLIFKRNSYSTQSPPTAFEKSDVPFKFGNGWFVQSYQTVSFSAKVGNHLCTIKIEVVECQIPQLLRKESLAGVVINKGKYQLIMLD